MEWIDFATPKTISEAVELLASKGDRARLLAGGTDLIVQLRGGRRSLDLVVDGKQIPELNEMSYSAQSGLVLGAAVPCYKLYGDSTIAAAYPGLMDSATALPVQIYLWAESSERGYVELTAAGIIVILAFMIVMNTVAMVLRKRFERRW